jgi:hypothetical protein
MKRVKRSWSTRTTVLVFEVLGVLLAVAAAYRVADQDPELHKVFQYFFELIL